MNERTFRCDSQAQGWPTCQIPSFYPAQNSLNRDCAGEGLTVILSGLPDDAGDKSLEWIFVPQDKCFLSGLIERFRENQPYCFVIVWSSFHSVLPGDTSWVSQSGQRCHSAIDTEPVNGGGVFYSIPVAFPPDLTCANDYQNHDCRPLGCTSPTCPDAFLTPTSGGCPDGRSPAVGCMDTFSGNKGFIVTYYPATSASCGGAIPCNAAAPEAK